MTDTKISDIMCTDTQGDVLEHTKQSTPRAAAKPPSRVGGEKSMSEKAKEILANIAESTEKLDEKGKAFLEGYLTRAVQEAANKQEDGKEEQ